MNARWFYVAAAALAVAFIAREPVEAMIPVIDIGAITQEIQNVEQTVQVVQQTTQVVTQARTLVASAETDLRTLNPRNFGNISATINGLAGQGQNIGNEAQMAEAQFHAIAVANTIGAAAPNVAAQAAATNAQAQTAVGQHSDAQVTNETLASIRDSALLQTNLEASKIKGDFVGAVQGATALSSIEGDPTWSP